VKNPTHGGAGHPCFTPALPRQQSPTPGSVAAGFTPMTTTSTGRSFASSPVRSAAENEKSCIWTAGGEPSNDPSEYRYRRMVPGDASSVSTPSTTIAWSAPLIASRAKNTVVPALVASTPGERPSSCFRRTTCWPSPSKPTQPKYEIQSLNGHSVPLHLPDKIEVQRGEPHGKPAKTS
jgi:hypothetical protein